jgi:hypothetical protein
MDILTNYLPSLLDLVFRKAIMTKDGQVAMPVVVMASALPLMVSLLGHCSHTIIEVTDDEQSRWIQHWLAQRQDVMWRLHRLILVSAGSMIGSHNPSGRCHLYLDETDQNDEVEAGDRFSPPKLLKKRLHPMFLHGRGLDGIQYQWNIIKWVKSSRVFRWKARDIISRGGYVKDFEYLIESN